MTELRFMLNQECERLHTNLGLIEQDYLLSWMIYAISLIDELNGSVVLKGGTCLKKMYFGNYRISQDLDFTSYDNAPKGDALFECISQATLLAEEELANRYRDGAIALTCSRYVDKRPQGHPNEQEAFVVHALFPWHRYTPYTRVMLEFTRKQRIVNTPVMLKIKHEYPEPLRGEMLTFTLEEVFGEKLMAMYSNGIKLHERGWTRSRARDYYDLFRLLCDYGDQLDRQKIMNTILYKTDTKLIINSIADLFNPGVIELVKADWDEQLGKMIFPLPSFEDVVPKLRIMLGEFLKLPLVGSKAKQKTLQM